MHSRTRASLFFSLTRLALTGFLLVGLTGCDVLDHLGLGHKGKFWTGWWTPGDTVDNAGYHPDQPINFSHKLHAGEKKIPCQYCHSAARRSIVAGIPPVNTCIGCHKLVVPDREQIKLIQAKYTDNEPIVWTKVHDLPDFVRFSHKRHVLSDVACETCHGKVAEMDTVEQFAPLQMGWCVDCHISKGAPTACYTCHY